MKNPSALKIGQASKALGVSIDTLRRWEASGKIQPQRTPGGTRFYSLEELNHFGSKTHFLETSESDYTHFSHPVVIETIKKQQEKTSESMQDWPNLDKLPQIHPKIYAKIYAGAALCLILALFLVTLKIGLLSHSGGRSPIESKDAITSFQHDNNVLAASSIAEIGKFLEINADTVITGNLAVDGESIFGEGIIGKSTLSITGATTLSTTSVNSSFSVTGLSTLTGGLTSSGKITLTGNEKEILLIKPTSDPSSATKLFVIQNAAGTEKASIDNNGNASFAGTLKVSGATTLSSTISVSGAATLSGATTISSSLEVSGTTTLSGASTLAGATVISSAGAASTPGLKLTGAWYTGGSTTTTKPQLLVEPTDTTSTGWSASGTGIGVNAKSSFTGNLIDLQVAGTSKFKVDYQGTITAAGTITFSGLTASRAVFTDSSSNLATTGTSAALLNALSDETGTGLAVFGTSPTITTSLVTDSTTFALVNTTATTINFGGGATTALNIGNGSGTITNIGNSGGATAFNLITGTGSQTFTSNVATGTTTTSGFVFDATAITSGTGLYLVSDSVTTGKMLDIATSGNTWTGNGTTNGLINLASSSTAGTGSSSSILLNLARSGANANATHTAYGLYSSITNTGTTNTNVAGYFSATGAVTNRGLEVAAMTGATSTGLTIGALSGTTANTGINIGAISGASATGTGITIGNISTTGTTNYGIQLGTMTGGTTSNYQISTGVLTSATTTTNAQLNLGGVVTTGGTTNYGINVGALSGSGTTNYGINITALTSTGTTNTALNIGGLSGAGTNNYGIQIQPVTGASTANVALCFDCDGTYSASTVASGIQFGTDANAVTLYRSASDILRTGDGLTVDLDLIVSGGDITGTGDESIDIGEATANAITLLIDATGEVLLTSSALSPSTSDGNALGTTALMWADLFLASGGVINLNNGDVTLTHGTNVLAIAGGNVGIETTAPDAALEINHTTGDSLRLSYNDSDGSAVNYTDFSLSSTGALTLTGSAATLAASATAEKTFLTLTPGTITLTAPTAVTSLMETAVITGATIAADAATTVDKATGLSLTAPIDSTNATLTNSFALRILTTTSGAGTMTTNAGLYVEAQSAGATNNYGIYIEAPSGGATTNVGLYNAGTSTLAGAATINTSLLPDADDGAVLGASGSGFSDLFLASGAVINFAAGDVTLTHGTDLLTLAGGDLDITLPAGSNVLINASTTANTTTTGVIDLNVSSATDSNRGLDIAYTHTATGATTSYSAYNAWASTAVVAGAAVSQTGYGIYNTAAKTGADTATGTYSLYGLYSTASNTGRTDAGTVNTYGGYFDATGDTAGTASVFGLYLADVSGGDTNVALCFDCDGTYSASTVASGIQFGTDANAVSLYRSASDVLRTGDSLTVDLDLIVSGGDITGTGDESIDIGEATANGITLLIDATGEVILTSAAFSPSTSDGNALGTTALMWADLFLASGGVINLNNGDVTLTHGLNTLTQAGGDLVVNYSSATALNIQDGSGNNTHTLGSATGVVFNENAADLDFRIETDTNASAFVLDAGLFTGVGQLSIGAAAQGTATAFMVVDNPAITATANQPFSKLFIDNTAAATVPAGTAAAVSSLRIDEPNITATGTVTNAATVYITGAPTEGANNNVALWVNGDMLVANEISFINQDGTGAADTNLYRIAGSSLQTDDNFTIADARSGIGGGNRGLTAATSITITADMTGTGGYAGITSYPSFNGAFTVTNAYALRTEGIRPQSGNTVTNAYGLAIAAMNNGAVGTITNAYGIWVETQAGIGSTNYGARIDAADTYTLWVSGNTNSTAATGGITFGSSGDTNLYRSAANTLTTDDAFSVGSLTTANTTAVCWDNSGASLLYDCDGSASDLAEYYGTSDTSIEAGDLVIIDPAKNAEEKITTDSVGNQTKTSKSWIVKSDKQYQNSVIGIISTSPNIVFADDGVFDEEDNPKPVALAGRVPVKVSTENGPIEKGDYLTSSSVPGVAMKAIKPGPTIGKALESFSCSPSTNAQDQNSCQGRILTFVNVSWADPGQALANLLLDEQGNLVIPKVKTASLEIGPIGPISQIGQEQESALDVASKLKVIESDLIGLDEQIATQSAQLAKAAEELASASAELAKTKSDVDLLKLTPPEIMLATGSATLANIKATDTLSSEKLLTALNVNISGVFKALGESFLGNTTIAGNLVVDGTFSISGNSINAIGLSQGQTLSTQGLTLTSGILYLQNNPLSQGLDILNGKFIFDKTGKLTVTGTVEAEQFSVTSGKSAGTGKILAGQTESIIENSFVKSNSVILVTPKETLGQTLAVVEKTEGQSFKVSLSQTETKDINFDYLIIGVNQKVSGL